MTDYSLSVQIDLLKEKEERNIIEKILIIDLYLYDDEMFVMVCLSSHHTKSTGLI